ncbi:MAG: hypothetical protein AAF598_07990, partial [Bacteroidota bacterium]
MESLSIRERALPPIEVKGIQFTKVPEVAAGFPAIKSSLGHAFSEMNLGRCTKTLFSVNQMKGFDCHGCAWPDPDDHRSGFGEYCENGVKAIAEEATTKRINAAFFA